MSVPGCSRVAGARVNCPAPSEAQVNASSLPARADNPYRGITGPKGPTSLPGERALSETIVDLQASYEFDKGCFKGWSIFLQGHNWTNTPFREYTSDPNQITNTVVYGRTYTAGVNVAAVRTER